MRTGGWGKHNFHSGGAFRKAKYEKLRRRESEGGAGIHFPHTPFSSRPARARNFSALPHEARQSKFKIRIFVKIGSDFNQKAPPIFKIRILDDCCLALATLGLGKSNDFIRIFEIQKQFLPAQTKVRTNLFSFVRPLADKRQSDNLILTAQ